MFSATFMCGNSAPRWKTMFVGRRWGGTFVTSVPWIRTVPRDWVSKPAMIRSSVVLPQPDGPSREMNSRGVIVEIDAVEDVVVAEALLDADDLHRGSACTAHARLRPTRLETTTRTTSVTRVIVASALTDGSMPLRTRPQM